MNIRKRAECNCIICGKQFYPSSKMSGKYCSRKCADIGRVKSKYEEYIQNPSLYKGARGMKWVKKHILQEQEGNVIFVDAVLYGIDRIYYHNHHR